MIDTIHNIADELGFSQWGVAKVEPLTESREYLTKYLARQYNGDMQFMERNLDMRLDPGLILENAKSIILFLAPYNLQEQQSQQGTTSTNTPKVASFAHGLDYHKVIKDKLHIILGKLKSVKPDMNARVFTDSAPVLERTWAVKAGLGWIGKNNFLINKELGASTFIGSIVTDLEIEPTGHTESAGNYCGKCRKCIDACPTGALIGPYEMDARRCISYTTIESKSPQSGRNNTNWIFGCDECMNVCPWAKQDKGWSEFSRNSILIRSLCRDDWQNMDEDTFRKLFKDTPLTRAGLNKIKSNLNNT